VRLWRTLELNQGNGEMVVPDTDHCRLLSRATVPTGFSRCRRRSCRTSGATSFLLWSGRARHTAPRALTHAVEPARVKSSAAIRLRATARDQVRGILLDPGPGRRAGGLGETTATQCTRQRHVQPSMAHRARHSASRHRRGKRQEHLAHLPRPLNAGPRSGGGPEPRGGSARAVASGTAPA